MCVVCFCFKQKPAYELRISDWSSDVCSSDLALYLTNHSDDVTLIHRRDELRSEKILQERMFANPKISTLWNKAVESFEAGENGTLSHIVLKEDRKRDVKGKSVSVRVDLVAGSIIKKKHK